MVLIELLCGNKSVLIGCAVKHSVYKNTFAVLAPCSLGTLKNAASGVSSRNGSIVSENDGFTVSTLDAGGYNVTHSKFEVSVFKVFALVVLDPSVYRAALGCHRCKHYHSVAAVDVEALCNWAELVSGVDLSVSVHIVVETVVTVLVTESYFVAKIVVVATLAVKNFTEESLLDHIENEHFVLAVAAVFKHHYRYTGALVCLYEIPALIEIVSTADLRAYVFAEVHAVDADLNMCIPRGGNDNTVYLGLIYDFFVIGTAVKRLVSAYFLAEIDAPLNSVLVKVANTDYLNVLDIFEAGFEQTASASAKSYNGNVKLFHDD
jgi:hypothetical protein